MIKISKYYLLLFTVASVLIISIILSVSVGQVHIPFGDSYYILLSKIMGRPINVSNITQPSFESIIWLIRTPRTLMAIFVGIGLSLCGVIMQTSVQNPLADPYILGVSSGASLGATFAILIGFSFQGIFTSLGVSFWAFLGAFIAVIGVLTLSNIGGKITSVKLVLAGTIMNAILSALSNFIIYLSNNAEGIQSVTFWTMGSLTSSKWSNISLPAIVVTVTLLFFMTQGRILNTMMMGEDVAITLGIDVAFYRKIFLIITSFVTGVLVANCGIIGFVGLTVPHICRSLIGSDNKKLVPFSALFGATFLLIADIISRVIIDNTELPIGVVTSLIGAPIFMYILIKKNYGFGGQ
ncbi:MAG: FecCD family ABC transporter permease [Bacteroidales bacterium]